MKKTGPSFHRLLTRKSFQKTGEVESPLIRLIEFFRSIAGRSDWVPGQSLKLHRPLSFVSKHLTSTEKRIGGIKKPTRT